MSDWVNWQQFQELNAPQVAQDNAQLELDSDKQQQAMDASLRQLSSEAMSSARAGHFGDVSQLGSYSSLMDQQKNAPTHQPLEQVAPWESELGRNAYANPWAELGKKLGGISESAARTNTQTLQKQAADKQAAEMKAWNEAQKRAQDAAMDGKKQSEADQYAQWSDYVQSHANGGAGAGAYYDWASGKGVAPVMSPSSPRQDKLNEIYRRNPSYVPSSNFGNTNNAGGTIFTGNWSF